jgi:DeoR family transcriptional regulator, suf operon transcriptional repressor
VRKSSVSRLESREQPESSVSAAGMRIVRLLVGNPPRTVSELIKTTGVTRTAVTEQLNELVAAGFVERKVERLPGRGRPRHLYSASSASLLALFASNEQLLVPAIWKAIEEVGGQALIADVLKRVSLGLAEHYRRRVTGKDPAMRLREMAELLREEGRVVDITGTSDQPILVKRSCAFFSMFEERRAVCLVDEGLMSAVVGCPVRRVACRHDGDPCCSFEIIPNGAH